MKKDSFIKKIIGFLFTISGMGWWVKKLPKHMPYKEYSKTAVISVTATPNPQGNYYSGITATPLPGEFIVIDFISFVVTNDTVIAFEDSAGNPLTGAMPLKDGQSLTWENTNHDTMGVMTCAAGASFLIRTDGAGTLGGMVRYRVVGN